ncbi:MAG: PAS domain S-box protein [Deltaproteobacteria bacterium]
MNISTEAMKITPEGERASDRIHNPNKRNLKKLNLVFEINARYEFVYFDPKIRNVLDYEADELRGKNFLQHVHPDESEYINTEFGKSLEVFSNILDIEYNEFEMDNVFNLIKKEKVAPFLEKFSKTFRTLSANDPITYRFKQKNGDYCWLESVVTPVLNPDGGIGITVRSRDLTDLIKVQESLKFSLRKLSKKSRYENIIRTITQDVHSSIDLQEVFDNAVDAIHRNVAGAENVSIHIIDGENAVIKSYRGYPDTFVDRIKVIPYPKDYTWKTIIDEKLIYCADVDRDSVVGRVGREIGVKSYLSMPIHSRNSVLGVINISSTQKDIFYEDELVLLELISRQIETAINNARKAEKLRKSEERFRTLFENVPTGVYRITPYGQILDANPAFIAMLGYSSMEEFAVHEIENQHFRSDTAWRKVKNILDRDGEIKGMESVWNKRDATEIYVLENITVIKTNDGKILFYEGTVEDITERKVAEDKLKEINMNLEKEIGKRTNELTNANESLRKEIKERRIKEYELKNSYKQLRALTKHLESVREEERTKISREVHDELGQSLTGLKIDLGLLSKQLDENDYESQLGEINERIKRMSALVDSNIQSVRRIAMELRPGVLDDLGTVAAIEWQAQDFEKLTGIECRFNSEVQHIPLNREVSTALFRMFQEILTNVAQHSEATIVNVSLKEQSDKYLLKVEDNGVGILEESITAPQSLGLLGMKERALIFGGTINITGKPKKGTAVLVGVPKGRCTND